MDPRPRPFIDILFSGNFFALSCVALGTALMYGKSMEYVLNGAKLKTNVNRLDIRMHALHTGSESSFTLHSEITTNAFRPMNI